MNISDKAIAIAVRTFFCDAHDKEQEIFEWLQTTTEETFDNSPWLIWSEVEHLTPSSIYCLVDALSGDIIRSFGG